MSSRSVSSALLAIGLLGGCGGVEPPEDAPRALRLSDLESGPWSEQTLPLPRAGMRGFAEAAAQAERLTGLGAIDAGPDYVRGLLIHRVVLEAPSTARLALSFAAETGEVAQAESVRPPFLDVRFAPTGGYVALADALAIARSGEPGGLLGWRLMLDEAANWVYEVRILPSTGDAVRVRVDARSGEVRPTDATQ